MKTSMGKKTALALMQGQPIDEDTETLTLGSGLGEAPSWWVYTYQCTWKCTLVRSAYMCTGRDTVDRG